MSVSPVRPSVSILCDEKNQTSPSTVSVITEPNIDENPSETEKCVEKTVQNEKQINTEQTLETGKSIESEKSIESDKPSIQFKCYNCSFNEKCHYKGLNPPFANRIHLYEESYVMKDPFSAPPGRHSTKSSSEYFIVLGAHCAICDRSVCKGIECSFYYSKTFCLSCASDSIKQFPLEIQSRIKKQIASIDM